MYIVKSAEGYGEANCGSECEPMSDNRPPRWCIYIDILGFCEFWEHEEWDALHPLRELMQGIYTIGKEVSPKGEDRLFVHQMGDGFAIVSEFHEDSLERPLEIAIALMRCVASTGKFAAAAIAEGDFADITGGYPKDVQEARDGCGGVPLDNGHMTLSTVMGTAFIRAYRLHKEAPPGPFITISQRYRDRIPDTLPVRTVFGHTGEPLLSVDWIRAESELLRTISTQVGLNLPKPDDLKQKIKKYCETYPHIGEKWSSSLFKLLDVDINQSQ